MTPAEFRQRVDATAARYRQCGRVAESFARGKLTGDPFYRALPDLRLIPNGSRLLDLGCGRGLLGAWLTTDQENSNGGCDTGLASPTPQLGSYQGIELMLADAECARRVLGCGADVVTGDMQSIPWGPADVVVMLDVIYFLTPEEQEALLTRVHHHLGPGGVLLLRVADASNRLRYGWTRIVDHLVAWWRGHGFSPFHCRPLGSWLSLLERLGFSCEMQPMSAGTPFANVLIVARPRSSSSSQA